MVDARAGVTSFLFLSQIRDMAQQFCVLVQVARHLFVVVSFQFAVLHFVVEKSLVLNQGCLVHCPIVNCWAFADAQF